MEKSPELAQMALPRSVAKLLHHRLNSELAGLDKSSTLLQLQPGQNGTINYKVFAGTWNVGGVAPPDDLDLKDWLDTTAACCDIYVLGFQEIVPLNARNVLGPKKRSAAVKWDSLIADALNNTRRRRRGGGGAVSGCREAAQSSQRRQDQDVFRRVTSKQLVGIFVSVWARSALRRHVRHLAVSCVRAGVLGLLGNKGAVTVRFVLQGTSFCFVCCHLASGSDDGDVLLRNADVGSILSRTRFHGRGSAEAEESSVLPKTILHHDRVVLLGDLNYRIAMDDDEARQLVRARKWSMLLENDELLLELSKGRQFDGWHEGLVTFAPTYKYHRNSDKFYWWTDGGANNCHPNSKQHRAPAWCDRILWRGKGMMLTRYESCGGYRLSDHRAVRAVFHAVCEVVKGV